MPTVHLRHPLMGAFELMALMRLEIVPHVLAMILHCLAFACVYHLSTKPYFLFIQSKFLVPSDTCHVYTAFIASGAACLPPGNITVLTCLRICCVESNMKRGTDISFEVHTRLFVHLFHIMGYNKIFESGRLVKCLQRKSPSPP